MKEKAQEEIVWGKVRKMYTRVGEKVMHMESSGERKSMHVHHRLKVSLNRAKIAEGMNDLFYT